MLALVVDAVLAGAAGDGGVVAEVAAGADALAVGAVVVDAASTPQGSTTGQQRHIGRRAGRERFSLLSYLLRGCETEGWLLFELARDGMTGGSAPR